MTLSQLRDYPRFSHQAKQRYTKKKVDTRFFFFESQTGERVTEITEKTKTGIKHKHVFLNFSHNYPPGTCSAVVCFDSDVMASVWLVFCCCRVPQFFSTKKRNVFGGEARPPPPHVRWASRKTTGVPHRYRGMRLYLHTCQICRTVGARTYGKQGKRDGGCFFQTIQYMCLIWNVLASEISICRILMHLFDALLR